jgi:hypothetical protein
MNDLMPSSSHSVECTSYKTTILVFTHAMNRQQRLCEEIAFRRPIIRNVVLRNVGS